MNPLSIANHPNLKSIAFATFAGILALVVGTLYLAHYNFGWTGVGVAIVLIVAAIYLVIRHSINKYKNVLKNSKGNLATDLIALSSTEKMAISKEDAEKLAQSMAKAKSNFTRTTRKTKSKK